MEAPMTAQAPDILLYRGKKLALCEQILYPYLRRLRKSRRPDFVAPSTACWRGYIATWEVRDDILHLVELDGWLRLPDDVVQATIATALPWVKGSLPATWFSGWIRCPEGRLLDYVHAGYSSLYERDRSFFFEEGKLAGEYLTLNPPAPISYRISPDGTRTCVSDFGPLQYELEDPLAGEDVSNAHLFWGRPPEGDEDTEYMLGGYTTLSS